MFVTLFVLRREEDVKTPSTQLEQVIPLCVDVTHIKGVSVTGWLVRTPAE